MTSQELVTILRQAGGTPETPPWDSIILRADAKDDDPTALVAELVALLSSDQATSVIRAAAGQSSITARRLALELAAGLPKIDPALLAWLRPLLRDRRLPRAVLTAGAAALLRLTASRRGATARVFRDFAEGYGRLHVLAHRAELRGRFNGIPAFDLLCARLRRTIPMRCPRCGVKRRPASMVRHLWRRHHRLLVGRRVRSPLTWLGHWAARAPQGADPDDGLTLLSRHLLRRKVVDPDSERSLRAIAARRKVALCPHCFAYVPLPAGDRPQSAPLRPLEISPGRLSGEGYLIARLRRGLAARIEIVKPGAGREELERPRGWDRMAAIRGLAAPWFIYALVLAIAAPPAFAIIGAALALSLAYVVRLAISAWSAPESAHALIDAAWSRVVAPILDQPWNEAGLRFVARLSLASADLGSPRARAQARETALKRAAVVFRMGTATSSEFAAITALGVCDSATMGDDSALALTTPISEVFRNDGPLSLLEELLARTPWRTWPVGRRARLRALVCAAAFEAELGVWELVELGQIVPDFGSLVSSSDLDGLARLRLVWSLRRERPWRRCGPASTVFELAAYPFGEAPLASAPDALLYASLAEPGRFGRNARLFLTGRGLLLRGNLLTAPAAIEVHLLPAGRGFVLHFGSHRFRYADDPTRLALKLSEWSEYLFNELLPQVNAAVGKPDGQRLERLLRSKTLSCPDCGGLFRG